MIPEYIIIHHSLTKDGTVVDWQAIRRYHIESNGWNDVGYHFCAELINDHWEILLGRLWNETGAHCKEAGMNFRSLGICVVGNYDETDLPEPAYRVLLRLVRAVAETWHIPRANVRRHHDFANYKTCPGVRFPWDRLIGEI